MVALPKGKTGVSLGLHSNLFPTNSKAATAETSFHVAAAPSAPSASTLRNPYAPARALKSAREYPDCLELSLEKR